MRVTAVLLAMTFLVAVLQLSVGSSIPPLDTFAAVLGGGDVLATTVLVDLRLPRVAVGLAAGACLGIAGSVLQAVLRNPLASPEVTGVGSGAVLGAVVATVVGGPVAEPSTMVMLAAVGGLVGGGLLWLVAASAGGDPLRLTLVGVLVSAVLAGSALILLTAKPQLGGAMTRWLVGSLGGRTWEHWAALWPFALVAVIAGILLAPVLDLLRVDDDHALGLGLDLRYWRPMVLLLAVLATAASVAAVGALAFVGLLAPHAARVLVGVDHRIATPVAAVAGALTVALADTVAQAVSQLLPTVDGRAGGLPAGAVTAVAGALVMIRVAQRRSSSV